ncbi:EAL domain-containing protein [Cognatiyoonia sp. IB215182]|uniref:EAL domain-containing protein n=1 Tax=Cognatiyoonia sp. IB215182 TaxID=3097353 RepID=UPI002A0F9025|nr:EAL domain-containing protein [Cognatiyoonia sp. IB215182]MDX8351789.1 EAL domain-containing protein [Cognatiyoonia sp. IB215182]
MPFLRSVCIAILIVATTFAAERNGFLSHLNASLEDVRSANAVRDASGQFVFVAIDAKSLQSVGAWPWSRQVYADILDQLTDSGALDVFFDIDFAFPADAAGDRAFAEALEKSGNAYLAVFQQPESVDGAGLQTNRPQPLFATQGWPVLANVFSDQRGLVRFYPFGRQIEGQFLPSAAALLSGRFSQSEETFRINFAIRPDTVPTYSASDVAAGLVPGAVFEGRSVIIGASAIELGDLFAVPVHGIVPGALVHTLAAETIAGGIIPVELRATWVFVSLFGVLLLLQTSPLQNPRRTLTAAGGTLIATEAGAFAMFLHGSIVVPTAAFYPALAVHAGWYVIRQLTRDYWIIRRQRREVESTTGLLQQVFADSSDAIVVLEASGATRICSQSAVRLFGLDPEGNITLPDELWREINAVRDGEWQRSLQSRFVNCAGHRRHLEYTLTPSQTVEIDGGEERSTQIITLSARDVTTIKEQERRIAQLSNFDELTGAMRRNRFLGSVERRLKTRDALAIFVFNLSQFKAINVVLGRDVGDEVLRHVVKRIDEAELDVTDVARLGGDTFACCAIGPMDHAQTLERARKIVATISTTYDLETAKAQVGARIGFVTIRPEEALSPADALSRAEEALDQSRSLKDGKPQHYDPVQSKRQFRFRQIERSLSGALDRGEFQVWYQPQHRISDGQLIGSEALVRWNTTSMGRVSPDEFIQIAESTGFIRDVGRFVLEQAVEDALAMPQELSVAVNVSGAQLMGGDVCDDVRRVLREKRFPASRLCLELTESVLLDGSPDLEETMRDIQFLGVGWALDDFGTGYSSMAYLTQLPLEKIKLDKSFVMSLGQSRAAEPIVSAVHDLCKRLGMKLLCEGVETEAQLAFLQANGCDEVQGYLFGKPMCLTDFQRYVLAHTKEKEAARVVGQ